MPTRSIIVRAPMPTSNVQFDKKSWPVVLISFHAAKVDAETLRDYFDGMDELLARGERFAVIVDARLTKATLDPRTSSEVKKWFQASKGTRGKALVCIAVVLKSRLLATFLSRALSFGGRGRRGPRQFSKIVRDTAEGATFCIEQLDLCKIELPEGPDAVRARWAESSR